MNWDWNKNFNLYSSGFNPSYQNELDEKFKKRYTIFDLIRIEFKDYIKTLDYTPFEEIKTENKLLK